MHWDRLLIISALTLSAGKCAFSAPSLDDSLLKINAGLNLDFYTHKLGDNWAVAKSGDKGINNAYTYYPSSTTSNPWENISQQSLLLDIDFKPYSFLDSYLSFEFLNDYAPRYWQPINLEHRMNISGQSYYFKKADIRLGSEDNYINYFRGIGHYNWSGKGDMFGLFPEQSNTEDTLRISGYPVPEGFGVNLQGDNSSLQVMAGPEIIWGYRNGFYGNYNFSIAGIKNAMIYTEYDVPSGDPKERQKTFELSFGKKNVQFGLLYRPYRLDRDYIYVEDTSAGQGTFGSSFIEHTAKTGQGDAFGGSFKISTSRLRPLGVFTFQYTGLGLVAGNKQEVSLKLSKKAARSVTAGIEVLYRKPLIGPVPLVSGGTASNPGPIFLSPRGIESPFTVGWDNREANIITLNFLFDKSPGTWFFLYQPDLLEDWNINTENDPGFSVAAQCRFEKYMTATDRLTYRDELGNIVWEPVGVTGVWATEGYLTSFKAICKLSGKKRLYLYDIGVGESPATGSFPYSAGYIQGRLSTGYLTTSFLVKNKVCSAKLKYGQNIWGPEEWQRTFGEVIDSYYGLELSRTFYKDITVGFQYTGVKETDKQNIAPDLGDYDEIKMYVHYTFGPMTAHF